MSEELKKMMKYVRELDERQFLDQRDNIRLFAELFLLLHQDLQEIKVLLENHSSCQTTEASESV